MQQQIYVDAAKAALTEIETMFQEEMSNLEKQRDMIESTFSGTGAGIGGQTGQVASSSYEKNVGSENINFNGRVRDFSNRVEEVITKAAQTTTSAQSIYS